MTLDQLAKCVQGINQALDDNSPNVLSHISMLATNLHVVKSYRAESVIREKIDHVTILQTHVSTWKWLDHMEKLAGSLFDKQFNEVRQSEMWIFTILKDAKNMVENRTGDHIFSPSAVGIIAPELSGRDCLVAGITTYATEAADMKWCTLRIVMHVLCEWTGAADDIEKWRGWMLYAVTCAWGERAVFLDDVWTMFITTKRFSVLRSPTSTPARSSLKRFYAALLSHPLAIKSTESVIAFELIDGNTEVDFASTN
ncbi:hypothetical protein BDN70DRAFT_940178 [Pholiota conissans]|uniref:Uncharacterized protein n=1 Tax=Pholiota conissans TaxID=109636 RepID=A0A9P5YIP6_9AGAR|nr:hypothetical protein BDN70DRAFT_940178 [Pholiota conissans]